MARSSQFKAYSADRKKSHLIDTPPARITSQRLDPTEWHAWKHAAPACSRVSKRKSAKRQSRKAPKRAIEVLRAGVEESTCLQCGRGGDDNACGNHCYRSFRAENFISAKDVDVKQHPSFTYGAYTAPGVTIRSGQFLEEYLGDLRPPGHLESLYCFEIPGVGVVDAEEAGNWTRFVNSHCRPNVTVWGDCVGKRHVVVFQAIKDIGPEEEIVWNYGQNYFKKADFQCGCDAKKSPHGPSK